MNGLFGHFGAKELGALGHLCSEPRLQDDCGSVIVTTVWQAYKPAPRDGFLRGKSWRVYPRF